MLPPNSSDDYLNIETPENVAFGYEIAGLGSRFLAALLDTFFITLLQVVVLFTIFLVARSAISVETDLSGWTAWVIALFGLLAFAFFWGYYIFFELLWAGQSPGKRWIGLRVIRRDGTPLTLSESIIRNLVRLVDFLPAYYGVGVVAMFLDGQTRRLGDMAAGTLVVREKAQVTLESLTARVAQPIGPVAASADGSGWPVSRLTAQDIELAEDFLRRRPELANGPQLAQQILNALCARMQIPAETFSTQNPEDALAALIRAAKTV